MADLDFTDLLEKGATFTSNLARVLRGVIDGVERGAVVELANLRPLAEQADAFFGNQSDPVPPAPEGGVPVDEHLEDDATAAQTVGAVSG